MSLLLNILWFIFGGFISGTLWLLAALLLAVSLIGLPWAPAAARMAMFSYAPFGKRLSEGHAGGGGLLLNVLWLVFVGWWLALHHVALACVLAITIIGLPFAWQHLKLAMASLAPVGSQLINT